MFSALTVRNFRIYWVGMFISLVGTWIQSVAQSWLVFELTHSAFLLGIVGFLGSLPILLLSLFGGVLADRINKRSILIFTQTAFMLLAAILAVLTARKLIMPWHIMCIAVLNGAVMAFDAPTRQAMVMELVGPEKLFNAIVLNSVAFNASRIIGPAIAGVLVAAIGMSGCFVINTASFLPIIAALAWINIPHRQNRPRTHPLKDLWEGLVFVRDNRLILLLISMVGIVSLFGVAYVILMPIFAHDVLHSGMKGLGILMSATGFGALIGALMLAALGDFRRTGILLSGSTLVFSVSLVIFSLSTSFIFSAAALVLIGSSSVIAISLVNTLLQTKVPHQFRGRVMGVFMLTFAGMLPFGNLFAGTVSQVWGVSVAVMLSGILCTLFFAFTVIRYPELRRL